MITIRPRDSRCEFLSDHVLRETRFPDGTSQVWHLPQEVLEAEHVTIDWRFEDDRELMVIASLKQLLDRAHGPQPGVTLYLPFLPYARQDKPITNDATFNLRVFGRMLNLLEFDSVKTVDVHSDIAEMCIDRLRVVSAESFHEDAMRDFKPDAIVFPDAGAMARYGGASTFDNICKLSFKKVRDQGTGNILRHELDTQSPHGNQGPKRFLIIDDLCDGGATFRSIAEALKAVAANEADASDLVIGLYVTHGIFSKGTRILRDAGIKYIYTTDSYFDASPNRDFTICFAV